MSGFNEGLGASYLAGGNGGHGYEMVDIPDRVSNGQIKILVVPINRDNNNGNDVSASSSEVQVAQETIVCWRVA